ncbi:MAG: FHA domain-containing protein [Chloroflexota bacterium]
MPDRKRGLILLFLIFSLLPVSARAQTAFNAVLSTPDTSLFPIIQAYLDLHDSQGQFMHGIQETQVSVLENSVSLPLTSFEKLHPGAQFVIAIDPGPAFGIRNSQAISRYDYIKTALSAWANSRQGSSIDDWSLVITGGPSISHVVDPAQWLQALSSDEVDARNATPSLDTLVRAVSLAADPSPRPGMGRAVLLIAPPVESQAVQSVANLASQAKQQGVIIHVWMVASAGAFSTAGAKALTDLAAQTGGSAFSYTGEEALPDLEAYLEPLRYIYHIQYRSQITTGGTQQLAIQVQTEDGLIETNLQNFEFQIQPPEPAFIAPPIQIQRAPPDLPEDQNSEETLPDSLVPLTYTLQVVFDFPDGRKRPLVQSALFVDGVLVDENNQPPYDQFTWDLTSYTSEDTHLIQVQITDDMGLVGKSVELPVLVSIKLPQTNPWSMVQRNLPIIASLVVLLAGAVLLLVLVMGGQLRPSTLRAARNQHHKTDPVTQPVVVDDDTSTRHRPAWVNRLQWPHRNVGPKAYAFLTPISDTDNMVIAPPIPITTGEVVLGSNPNQATLVLEDASIEGAHARLQRQPDETFRLADEGSVAGTWINYAPVSKEGAHLEHGDLIHIGRVGFRFTLRQPAQVRKPVITPLATDSQPEPTPQTPPEEVAS